MAKANCPRDSHQLDEGEFHGIPVMHCQVCDGTLIKQASLFKLLTEMIKELSQEISFESEIAPVLDKGPNIECPACHTSMQNYGYMGSSNVMIDSCGECSLLWIHTNEMAVMCLMNERANKRLKHYQEMTKEHSRQLDKYVLQEALHGAFMRGFRMGYGAGLLI